MSLFDSARFQISAAKLSGLPTELEPEIAFAGRSNAGKSLQNLQYLSLVDKNMRCLQPL